MISVGTRIAPIASLRSQSRSVPSIVKPPSPHMLAVDRHGERSRARSRTGSGYGIRQQVAAG